MTRDAQGSLASLGRVIATYAQAAVEFDDADAAREALATLATTPDAEFAVLLRADGGEFASWGSVPADVEVIARAPSGASLMRSSATFSAPIESNGQRLGTLVLRRGLDDAITQLVWITGVMLAIGLGAFALAAILSARLRDEIAQPLAELARSAFARNGARVAAILQPGATPLGEAREIATRPYLSILGTNPRFHAPDDRWPYAVDLPKAAAHLEALVEVARELAS